MEEGPAGEKKEEEEDGVSKRGFYRTANPHNAKNIELHRNRFRNDKYAKAMIVYQGPLAALVPRVLHDSMSRKDRLITVCGGKDWEKTHFHVKDPAFNCCRFVIPPPCQRLIFEAQRCLVDKAYQRFGKTVGSWEGYTLMYRNGFQSGDMRKPTTSDFQEYWLEVCCPIMFVLFFGKEGYHEKIGKHLVKHKACTIKVCEKTNFYGQDNYHMHIDGKVGILQEKNHSQRRTSRLLFSIVHEALDDPDNQTDPKYGTTVYPIWQPRVGFANNHEFHSYMHARYVDNGLLNCGLPRPHYEIPPDLVYRASPGEVLYHPSHVDKFTPQAIHAEPNPCPDRHLFVFDFTNLLNKAEQKGKYEDCDPIPEEEIFRHLQVLAEYGSTSFQARLDQVYQVAASLLPTVEKYPDGAAFLGQLLDVIRSHSSSG